MNGNPIFAGQGRLSAFSRLPNSADEDLVPKSDEIAADLVEAGGQQDGYPVILVTESGAENLRIQDGGIAGSGSGGPAKLSHNNLAAAVSKSSGGGGGVESSSSQSSRLSDDDILLFVRPDGGDGSPPPSMTVSLESPSSFLGSPSSAILPLDGGLQARGAPGSAGPGGGSDSAAAAACSSSVVDDEMETNPEVVVERRSASIALRHAAAAAAHHPGTASSTVSVSSAPSSSGGSKTAADSALIDHQSLPQLIPTAKIMTSEGLASGSVSDGAGGGHSVLGGAASATVRSSVLDLGDLTLGRLASDSLHHHHPHHQQQHHHPHQVSQVVIGAGDGVTQAQLNSIIAMPSPAHQLHHHHHHHQGSDKAGIGSESILIPSAEMAVAASQAAASQLEINVNTAAAGQPATAAAVVPLVYIITSRDRSTGAEQRFRVTVDSEAVATAPVDSLSLGAGILPSLQIGGHAGLQLAGEGAAATATMVAAIGDGCGDNPAVGVMSTQVVPGIDTLTTSSTTGLAKAELESGDASTAFRRFLEQKQTSKEEKVLCCTYEGCQEIFTTKKKLKLHQLAHADDRPHKCTVEGCDWTFPTLYKLRRHLAGHNGARPFTCEDCNAPFSTIYNLNMHRKRHSRPDVYVCEVKDCGMVFPTAIKLTNHLRNHFPERRIKCKYPGCNKSFTTTCGMGSHYRIHDKDETIFPCLVEGCNKVYNKACRLKLHMRSHTGERPFKCTAEGCTWAFTCIQKLSRHMVQHTGDRKYVCTHAGCQKHFTRLEHLKTHIKTHTGEKPFSCTEKDCGARFASRSSLFMHVKRHKQGYSGKQKSMFTCPMGECNQSYTTKDGLKQHILTVHSIMLPSASNESELVYIPTENPQAMVDAMTDPSLLQNPTVVRITPAADGTSANQLTVAPVSKESAPATATAPAVAPPAVVAPPAAATSQAGGLAASLTPYTSGAGLIVDSTGAPVSFVSAPTTQEAPASTWSAGALHHENWSGSARTDFMYLQGGKKGRLTRNSESGDSESDSALATSYVPTSFSMTTTASLTLRDPATGARYVQTQLLQDDPPDESELAFQIPSNPTTPDHTAGNLSVAAILPVAPDPGSHHHHAQCPPPSAAATAVASVDFLQADREGEQSMDDFRESTINMQDLE